MNALTILKKKTGFLKKIKIGEKTEEFVMQ